MKLLIPLLFLPLVSCTVMSGNAQKGTFTYVSFGGDAKGLEISASGAKAAEVNNSKSALSAIRTVGTISTAMVVNSMLENVQASKTSEVVNASNNATANVAAKEATKQAKIAADASTQALKITTP